MKHARQDYNRIQDPAGLIPDDEPVFLLRAKDRTAPQIVRLWAHAQKHLPDADQRAIELAERHADAMEAWQAENGCKTADVSPNVGVEGRQPPRICDSEESGILPSPRTTC